MAEHNRPSTGSSPGTPPEGRGSLMRQRLQAARERLEGGFASAITSAMNAAGLRISVQSPPEAPVPTYTAPPVVPRPMPRADGSLRAFPPADFTSSPRPPRLDAPAPRPPGSDAPTPTPLVNDLLTRSYTAQPSAASFVFPKAPLLARKPVRVTAPVRPQVQGPTPVQVMSAVQNAVVGAVKVVSGTIAGVGAARDAAVAAAKTAGGAASVASGMATVASGIFPQLAALGIGVPKTHKAPKNRPGQPPQRRVADIIANPMGKSPPPGSPEASGAPARPTQKVQRVPLVRAKSSLELSRKEKTRKRRSYDDLQMKPQMGLTPHEVLLKVATLALGKTLLGMLEAGARGQQKALHRASERMSQKQIMLLGMLPAQYIMQRMPQPQLPAAPTADQSTEQVEQAERPPAAKPGGPFKIRY